MTETDLTIGRVYFMVTYDDAELKTPVIITFKYLAEGEADGEDEPGFVFQYLPAYRYEDDPERSQADDAPLFFRRSELHALVDIAGLIETLEKIKSSG